MMERFKNSKNQSQNWIGTSIQFFKKRVKMSTECSFWNEEMDNTSWSRNNYTKKCSMKFREMNSQSHINTLWTILKMCDQIASYIHPSILEWILSISFRVHPKAFFWKGPLSLSHHQIFLNTRHSPR